MKVKFGEQEIELHPLQDVPKLAAIGALQAMHPGNGYTLHTLAGEALALRFNQTAALLEQVVDAA